jgi:hypothetical protein
MMGGGHLQVLQVFVEQVVQVSEEVFSRLLPPPIPKEDKSFWISLLLQDVQKTSFSFPTETRDSKCVPHFLHKNS